jgi:hypothetical protein
MMEENDWRLMGQEKFLKGVALVHRKYRQYRENPDWGHDHCSFCWVEFCLEGCVDAIQEGYAKEDDYHWICPKCFADFKDRFQWLAVEEMEESD